MDGQKDSPRNIDERIEIDPVKGVLLWIKGRQKKLWDFNRIKKEG
jgi:hypothetical protein